MPNPASSRNKWRKACLEKGFSPEFLALFELNRQKDKEKKEKRYRKAIEKAKRVADILKNNYRVEKVYLYGSLLWGGFHQNSDIDLYLVGFKGDYWEAYIKAEEMASPFEVNLVCQEDALSSLKEKVLEKGLLL